MRKSFRIFAVTAVALAATAMTAQAQQAKQFGIVAGVDFADITGTDFDGTSSKTGFVGGLYVAIPMGDRVAIEPEVLYASKGAQDSENSNFKLNNNYIEIPVLVRYSFNNNGGPYLLAGPAVGFSISCKITDGSTDVDCSDTNGLGLQTNTTFGGVVGLGFQKNRFGLEGRYDFDFGSAFKDSNGKNAVWEILARIMIK
ncbi:MAG: porin family protein [Gemmatimonadales bacterium]